MAFFFDHLTAVAVGATLLVAMLFVQQRGQQAAIEATARYQSQKLTTEFIHTIERDVENMRTMLDMDLEFGVRQIRIRRASADSGSYTYQFAFPTLLDPDADDASGVALVVYHVVPTGREVRVQGEPRPTYRATRYVLESGASAVRPAGGSGDLVDFDVVAFDLEGEEVLTEGPSDLPSRIFLSVVSAAPLPDRRAGDQASKQSTTTRLARMVRVANAAVPGVEVDVPSAPASLPALPGDPDVTF